MSPKRSARAVYLTLSQQLPTGRLLPSFARRITIAARGITMRTISLKLPEELDRRLAALAKRRRTSRSEVIRAALEAFEPAKVTSFTEAAGDLVGCLAGPKDLSTSQLHMSGYGR